MSDVLSKVPETNTAGGLAALARAEYANGVVATIYLSKAAMVAGLPQDIVGWQQEHGTFPNASTTDQFYGDREFEAYRELGWIAGQQACALRDVAGRSASPAEALRHFPGGPVANPAPVRGTRPPPNPVLPMQPESRQR